MDGSLPAVRRRPGVARAGTASSSVAAGVPAAVIGRFALLARASLRSLRFDRQHGKPGYGAEELAMRLGLFQRPQPIGGIFEGSPASIAGGQGGPPNPGDPIGALDIAKDQGRGFNPLDLKSCPLAES